MRSPEPAPASGAPAGGPSAAPAADGPAHPHRPVGLFAAVLAVLIAIGGAYHFSGTAGQLASRYVRALAQRNLPFKAQTLTLQRAALRTTDVLPVYGTSELYCCAGSFNAGTFFNNAPTGFAVFNVGYPVTEDLFWAETFGALGHALRGKRVVVSDSPWFTSGIAPTAYAHTFSPEIALVFTFDSPLPEPLRAAVARRMLDFPATLRGMPLLSAGLSDLAHGGLRGRSAYLLLDPLGRLDAWLAQLRDAQQTILTIDHLAHPLPAKAVLRAVRQAESAAPAQPWWRRALTAAWRHLRALLGLPAAPAPSLFTLLNRGSSSPPPLNPVVPNRPRSINWNAELRTATAQVARATASNPFGVLPHQWQTCSDIAPVGGPWCRRALQLYRAGRTNHDAQVYPIPQGWVQGVKRCPCWTDLNLEFQVLDSVQADAMAWVQPFQGALADHTPYSAPARRVVYDRYLAIAKADGMPATTFQTHDTDPLFMDSFGHLSQRGWVYADRLLNLFWQGRLGEVRAEMARGGSVDLLFPRSLNCPHPAWCVGVSNVRPLPGELANLP